MKDDDFKLLGGFVTNRQTDERMDICECRVAFATEKLSFIFLQPSLNLSPNTYCESILSLAISVNTLHIE